MKDILTNGTDEGLGVKRTHRQKDFNTVKEGELPVRRICEGVNMEKMMKNYYGSLCTEMYEILHKDAPQDELNFRYHYLQIWN